MLRTHTCGELTKKYRPERDALRLVDTIRDHGGLTFVDLRDRYGKTQVVLPQSEKWKTEDCMRITAA